MDTKIQMTVESFNNVLGMLNSPDKENIPIALQCIENMNYKNSMVYVIMLLKASKLTASQWLEHAPKVYGYLHSLNFRVQEPMTFKRIISVLKKLNTPSEDLQFFFDLFSEEISRTMEDMGFESFELKIIYKDGNSTE